MNHADWTISDESLDVIEDGDGLRAVATYGETIRIRAGRARRILACLKATGGLDTMTLERMPLTINSVTNIAAQQQEIDALRAQVAQQAEQIARLREALTDIADTKTKHIGVARVLAREALAATDPAEAKEARNG